MVRGTRRRRRRVARAARGWGLVSSSLLTIPRSPAPAIHCAAHQSPAAPCAQIDAHERRVGL